MKFTFRSGQTPLPGYTIKRGIGLGGFGEVYFAVTDGGKEVALKWIHDKNLEIEMRGVAQATPSRPMHTNSKSKLLNSRRCGPERSHTPNTAGARRSASCVAGFTLHS